MKFEILTVAEDGYESNRFTAAQRNFKSVPMGSSRWNQQQSFVHELRISVDVKRSLTVREFENSRLKNEIQFERADIDSLIQFLQEVKTFISEEEMVAKLMGKNIK